jgi:GNAT superfamily N-acetyltransferase
VRPPFRPRPYLDDDLPASLDLARLASAHGVYVANCLRGESDAEAEKIVLQGEERVLGLLLFGTRGNLVVVEREPLDGDAVARAVHASLFPWRIVLGPPATVQALARLDRRAPLVHRRQSYFHMAPAQAAADLVRQDVRPAERADRAALIEMTLQLNHSDLRIDPQRVDRAWLKELIDRRLQEQSTCVLGPPGAPQCKLDLGSQGACGLVIEGVFTRPELRGRHLAASLVATVAARAHGASRSVCLHVAAGNEPAKKSYLRAGMQHEQDVELLLRK